VKKKEVEIVIYGDENNCGTGEKNPGLRQVKVQQLRLQSS